MIPYYLKNHLVKIKEKKDKTVAVLSSFTGNTYLEIYYYGDLINIGKTPYIVDAEYPCLIVAKDSVSGEEFTIFDGRIHGYDAMFCNEYEKDITRELVKYEKYQGDIEITLYYGIDYEEEKEEYEFDNEGNIILMYGALNFEHAKYIGYDWISLKFVKSKKEFFEMELA